MPKTSKSERRASANRAWKARNREKILAQQRAWVAANAEKVKLANTRSGLNKYGLNFREFADMLLAQEFRCALCPTEFANRRSVHVDHDHGTGKVRGLLCICCNHALRKGRDSPNWLAAAIAYVSRG